MALQSTHAITAEVTPQAMMPAVTIYSNSTSTVGPGWSTTYTAGGSGQNGAGMTFASVEGNPCLALTGYNSVATAGTPSTQARRTFAGFTVGLSYTLSARIAVHVDQQARLGIAGVYSAWTSSSASTPSMLVDYRTHSVTFTATATTHAIEIEVEDNAASTGTYFRNYAAVDDLLLVQNPYILGGTPHFLPIKSATVTIDEAWSPYIQVTLESAVLSEAKMNDVLPSVTLPPIKLNITQDFGSSQTIAQFNADWTGKTFADFSAFFSGKAFGTVSSIYGLDFNASPRPKVTRSFELDIVSRTVNAATGTMTLELESSEAKLSAYGLLASAPVNPGGTSVRAAVAFALAKVGATLQGGTADAVATVESLAWAPGVTAWDYLAPLVQAGNLRLYAKEPVGPTEWYLVPSGQTSDELVVLSADNVTSLTETVSASDNADYFTGVAITYKWVDAAKVPQIAYDTAGTPEKVDSITYDRPYPGPGAASAMLTRAAGRRRTFDIEAMSDYTVEPGKSVRATLPGAPIQTGYVSAVSWHFPSNRMDVKTRATIDTPAASWLLANGAWSAQTATWTTYTP